MKHILKNQIKSSLTQINHYDIPSFENIQKNRYANKILSNSENKISFLSKLKKMNLSHLIRERKQQRIYQIQNYNLILKNWCKNHSVKLKTFQQFIQKKIRIIIKRNNRKQCRFELIMQLRNLDWKFQISINIGIIFVKYAIKIYDTNKINDSQKMNNKKRKISILKRINHSNVIKLIYTIENRKSV
ncbi:unnamed protein product [Paramecium sonneborni]|uniref:Uncharacterized protein n=1 Tax=Paramecium sonneborni TaxID=65129 RepID=A0A8S1PUF0_9CILI|nr:unnamed protein product [Paramecium sonneborni]